MSESEFHKAIQDAAEILPNFVDKFSVYFHVSKMTVRRWVEGKNAPYSAMRPIVIESIKNFLSDTMGAE